MEQDSKRTVKHDSTITCFADGLYGAAVVSGTARIDLFAEHFNPEGEGRQPVVVGRLVIPVERLRVFAAALVEMVQKLQQEQQKTAKT